jgi:hypothetical protein
MTDRETNTPADNTSDDADTNHTSFEESQSGQEAVADTTNPNVVAGHTQLTAMCRDFLRVVYALNEADDDHPPTGCRIVTLLETEYGAEIGAPYNRLDELVDSGLVEKQYLTGKRKTYHVTPRGIRLLEDLAYFTTTQLAPLAPTDD